MRLKPNGHVVKKEQVCTSTLVWPANADPTPENSILVDPCLTEKGWESAVRRLRKKRLGLDRIGYYFETHAHADHQLQPSIERLADGCPESNAAGNWKPLSLAEMRWFPGIELVPCPGHSPDLTAIRCDMGEGETWIVSDAILDVDWLERWMYYWPNDYDASEVADTWRSIGRVLATADVVIPGHGPPIVVALALR